MNLQHGISLGIPSRGITKSLRRVIDAALSTDVSEILVAINPPHEGKDLLEGLSDSRVKIHLHNDDVGLYGNFRWLVKNARYDLFKFLCTDDGLSPDLDEAIACARGNSESLTVLSYSHREYCPNNFDFFGMESPGRLPALEESLARILFSPEPSWIFGIWKTAWLQQNFPNRDFDWLDCILLARLIASGLAVFTTASPQTIGTWNWAGKIPAPVHERHKFGLALWHYIILLPRFMKLDRKSWLYFIQHVRNLRSGASRLNARLEKARLDNQNGA